MLSGRQGRLALPSSSSQCCWASCCDPRERVPTLSLVSKPFRGLQLALRGVSPSHCSRNPPHSFTLSVRVHLCHKTDP